ncbi:Pentatricopeptide repeat-containing protein 1, mitochondrial, partial [Orchesella cincta]
DIMRLLKDYKIKPDVTFFTVAIHRCNYYNLHDLSKEMLKQMSLYNVSPNIVTWAALALGCDNWKEGKSYLEEMEEAKFTPNTEVMYSLLFAAVRKFDPLYVCHVMEETRRRSITLNEKYLILLEKFYALTQRGLISKEMGKPVESKRLEDALERNPDFPEHFAKFKMRYPVWLKTVDIKIDPENPWKHEFEKFKTHGRHTIPEKGVKEDEDFPFEPEKRSSSKIK